MKKIDFETLEVWNDGEIKIIKTWFNNNFMASWTEYRKTIGGEWIVSKNHFKEPLFITRENKLNKLLSK